MQLFDTFFWTLEISHINVMHSIFALYFFLNKRRYIITKNTLLIYEMYLFLLKARSNVFNKCEIKDTQFMINERNFSDKNTSLCKCLL